MCFPLRLHPLSASAPACLLKYTSPLNNIQTAYIICNLCNNSLEIPLPQGVFLKLCINCHSEYRKFLSDSTSGRSDLCLRTPTRYSLSPRFHGSILPPTYRWLKSKCHFKSHTVRMNSSSSTCRRALLWPTLPLGYFPLKGGWHSEDTFLCACNSCLWGSLRKRKALLEWSTKRYSTRLDFHWHVLQLAGTAVE